ncbi:MAG: hypothetical protein HC900_12690, partial [Methylacidiphilales bacterium]|nr:hypothetical protein [Candidatus Methylacidiphilales bacterium]
MNRNLVKLVTVMVAVSTVALTFWLFGTKGIIDALQDYSPTALLLALGFLTL